MLLEGKWLHMCIMCTYDKWLNSHHEVNITVPCCNPLSAGLMMSRPNDLPPCSLGKRWMCVCVYTHAWVGAFVCEFVLREWLTTLSGRHKTYEHFLRLSHTCIRSSALCSRCTQVYFSLSQKKKKKNLSFFPLLFSISSGCPGEAPVTVKGQEWACSGVYRVANNTAKADKPPVDLPRALKHKPPLTICLKDVWKIPLDSLT